VSLQLIAKRRDFLGKLTVVQFVKESSAYCRTGICIAALRRARATFLCTARCFSRPVCLLNTFTRLLIPRSYQTHRHCRNNESANSYRLCNCGTVRVFTTDSSARVRSRSKSAETEAVRCVGYNASLSPFRTAAATTAPSLLPTFLLLTCNPGARPAYIQTSVRLWPLSAEHAVDLAVSTNRDEGCRVYGVRQPLPPTVILQPLPRCHLAHIGSTSAGSMLNENGIKSRFARGGKSEMMMSHMAVGLVKQDSSGSMRDRERTT
jgi:hypothetical protein